MSGYFHTVDYRESCESHLEFAGSKAGILGLENMGRTGFML
jgi:hypothetical protein